MYTNNMETALAVWLPLMSGILTIVSTTYGLHRTWQDRRREQRTRLADAARVAVRLAEAAYVRPLLRTRLESSVHTFVTHHSRHHHPTTARLRLFCQLQADVRLSQAEKQSAREHAYRELVELLRAMVHPPVRVPTEATTNAHLLPDDPTQTPAPLDPRLVRALEVAYNLTPRPAAVLIAELGAFAGRVGVLHGGGQAAEEGVRSPPGSPQRW